MSEKCEKEAGRGWWGRCVRTDFLPVLALAVGCRCKLKLKDADARDRVTPLFICVVRCLPEMLGKKMWLEETFCCFHILQMDGVKCHREGADLLLRHSCAQDVVLQRKRGYGGKKQPIQRLRTTGVVARVVLGVVGRHRTSNVCTHQPTKA